MDLKDINIATCFVDDSKGFWDGFWERRNGLGAAPHSADPDSASPVITRHFGAARFQTEKPWICKKGRAVITSSGTACGSLRTPSPPSTGTSSVLR